jgi:hypothetical protein
VFFSESGVPQGCDLLYWLGIACVCDPLVAPLYQICFWAVNCEISLFNKFFPFLKIIINGIKKMNSKKRE